MFSLLEKTDHWVFALSKEDREEFLDKYKSGLMAQYGAVMKEFVLIPENYFRLPPYFVTLSFITIVLIALEIGVLWFAGQPVLLDTRCRSIRQIHKGNFICSNIACCGLVVIINGAVFI